MASAPYIISPTTTHTASLIFLHGLGDSGKGIAPLAYGIAKKFPFMKFIFPHATKRPVTLNGGMVMPAWYDIYTLNEREGREDEQGIIASSSVLSGLVEEEKRRGIKSERIFIGGFSQGGAVSLYTGLTLGERLGGIVVLSCYLPLRALVGQRIRNKATPVFMGHGTADWVVQYRWGQTSAKYLKEDAGMETVLFKSYPCLDHSSTMEEIADVIEFLEKQLNSRESGSNSEL